jgi:L-malate glycosyltransferase
MKICYIADSDVITTIRYLRYFVEQGHEVYLIPTKLHHFDVDLEGSELDGINIINIYDKGASMIKLMVSLRKVFKSLSPDLIHIHSITRPGFAAAFVSMKIPVVLTPWGRDLLVSPLISQRARLKLRIFLPRISGLISGSSIMHVYSVKYGLNPERSYLINMGIDTQKFRTGLDTRCLRNKLNIPTNKKIVLVPRQWEEKQNTELILRSVPLVLKDHPNTVFIFKNIFGNLGPLLNVIKKELGLTNEVFLIDRDSTPVESYKELPLYYNLANIIVSIPNWDTGNPATVMEAMACGCFPIVSPANKKWITNRKNGLVIIPDSIESIANGIIEVLSVPKWMDGALTTNQKIIDWGGNFHTNMAEISNIYSTIIQKANSIK